MKRKSHRIRTVTKLNPEAWPHDCFTGFESPYSDALKVAFPPATIAKLIERLPPDARARLEREFGPLPTVTTPPIQ